MNRRWERLQRMPRFREEIQTWVEEGIISSQQAEQLIQRYELDTPAPWYMQSGWLLRGVGLLVIATGMLMLIAHHWKDFSTVWKAIIALLPLLASYAVALYANLRRHVRLAELAMFFATLLLGMNIWVQAQIFHISAYYPDGLLWWIIGALPFIWRFENKLMHLILTLLTSVWMIVELTHQQFSWWAFPIIGVLFYIEYRTPNVWTLTGCLLAGFLLLLGVHAWEMRHLQNTTWGQTWHMTIFLSSYPLLFLFAFQKMKPKYSEKANWLLESLAMMLIALLFFTLIFEEPLRELLEKEPISYFAIFLAISLTGIALRLIIGKQWKLLPYGIAFLWLVVPCLIPLTGIQLPTSFYFIFMNLGFVLFAAMLVIIAIARTKQKGAFMAGVFYLMLWVLGRYLAASPENYLVAAIIFILFGGLIYYLSREWDKKLENYHQR
ncbi:MAG: DUF2157 domain-containing protein [Cytophagales bacterium]|nr:DUF2157 domain-containing protein [Bernardetiaceae bacterium]MDW8211370.1 DUF2157 domain-containing protein [Cytophagales bacterium]